MKKTDIKYIKSLEKKVDAGIKFLDKNEKGWIKKIDLRVLDLSSPAVCVLGQLFNYYFEGLSKKKLTEKESVKYGFNLPAGKKYDYYDVLTHIWFYKLSKKILK